MEGVKRGVIISGGDITDFFEFKKDDIIVCADRGYEYAAASGIKPRAVIGDFDSLQVCVPREVEQIKYRSEKDETDTLLALLYLAGMGVEEIVIIGALGGRSDHSLANIMLLKEAEQRGIRAYIRDENTSMYLVTDRAELTGHECRYVSILPLFGDARGVTLSGMKYPLTNALLPAGCTMGISNEIADRHAEISLEAGCLLVIEIK